MLTWFKVSVVWRDSSEKERPYDKDCQIFVCCYYMLKLYTTNAEKYSSYQIKCRQVHRLNI